MSISRKSVFSIFGISLFLLAVLLAVPTPSYATLYKVPSATQTNQLVSNERDFGEYYKVTTDRDYVIKVEGKTKIPTKLFHIKLTKHKSTERMITVFIRPDSNGEFSVEINTRNGNSATPTPTKGTCIQRNETYGTIPGYRPVGKMGAGIYHLTVARATTSSEADVSQNSNWASGVLGGSKGYAYKEALLSVQNGKENNLKVVKYQAAIDNNNSIRNKYERKSYNPASYPGSYVRYQDTFMTDMGFVFVDPKTRKAAPMTSAAVSYIKGVADSVTRGASSNYERLLKIYEYVAGEFYYDRYAYEQCSKINREYVNPYLNIYHQQNKIASVNSTSTGKVATTCQGYAAMVIALARAEGIPARIVYGQHASLPATIWADKTNSQMSVRGHWWAEAWADGRWVIVDANSGTGSLWTRSSFTDAGTWSKTGVENYAHFDPTAQQFANSFSYNDVYPGSKLGKFVNRTSEINQLKSFLKTKSKGKSNGKRLNKKYSASDYSTWGLGRSSDFLTDGYGRVERIMWGSRSLAGNLNLSNFSSLRYLSVYSNKLNSINLKKCPSLTYVSAAYNKLKTFDGTASSKITEINLKGNQLTSVKFKHKNIKKTVSVSSQKAGNFGFSYKKSTGKATIYANNAKKGYEYAGVYTSAGKKLTGSKTYAFKPGKSKYIVKYVKKTL